MSAAPRTDGSTTPAASMTHTHGVTAIAIPSPGGLALSRCCKKSQTGTPVALLAALWELQDVAKAGGQVGPAEKGNAAKIYECSVGQSPRIIAVNTDRKKAVISGSNDSHPDRP